MNAELLEAIQSLDALARASGYRNIFQPGLAKELLIASSLGHTRTDAKHGHDAETPDGKLCEYLSCKEGGYGQIDRVFKAPSEKRARSLDRIARNDHVFLVIFDAEVATKILRIYELNKVELLAEMERQLDRSKTDIAHVGFSEKFAAKIGVLLFQYK